MRVTSPIDRPLADEHVIAVDPPLKPRLEDTWRRRINPFPGRALSHRALEAEQDWRAGAQRLRGQAVTAGIVEGLDVAPEPGAIGAAPQDARIQLAAGSGLTRSGEDVTVPAPRRVALADLRVHARVDHLDAIASGEPIEPPVVEPVSDGLFTGLRPLLPRRTGPAFGEVAASPAADPIPRAAVMVLEPVTATILAGERGDCPPDPRDDPYDDLQLIDGARLALYFWPGEVTSIAGGPDYALPPAGPALRNLLAYCVFETERVNGIRAAHPWETLGLPVALLGFNPDWTLAFIDRAAVVRMGGQPASRTPLEPAAGTPVLWQARVAQFAEQLAEEQELTASRLSAAYRFLPPTGFLPGEMVDFATRRQQLFPPNIVVSAAPMPLEQADQVIGESASLDPLDLGQPDSLELLLPVPQRLYEPRLLEIEAVDPAFAGAIARFEQDRRDWFARRERVRRKRDLLVEARSGTRGAWPAEDSPLAETAPSGAAAPLNAVRIRRLAAGQAFRWHAFAGAAGTIRPEAGDRLFVWVRVVDGRGFSAITLRTGAATEEGFDKAVWWGAPTNIPFIRTDEPGDLRRVGDAPAEGVWTRLEAPAAAEWGGGGLAGLKLDGFEFGQRGGTVEWGPLGLIDAGGRETVFLSELLPEGSREFTAEDVEAGLWPWVEVAPEAAKDEADFGVVADRGRNSVAAIAALRARWPQPFLQDDFATLAEGGLERFIDTVEARVSRTNDRVDLGFVRARADIYRLRQFMLGADAASKLVTSPALADLAVREESARARAEDLTRYLKEAYKHSAERDPEDPLTRLPRTTAAPSPTGGGSTGGGTGGAFLLAHPMIAEAAFPVTTFAARAEQPAEPFVLTHIMRGAPSAAVEQPAAVAVQPMVTRLIEPQISVTGISAWFAGGAVDARDVQAQRPLPGIVERSVSVAERIKIAPAVEIQDYSIAGKVGVLGAVSELVSGGKDRTGIALGDLPAPGFTYTPTSDPGGGRVKGTLGDVILAGGDYRDSDQITPESSRHEADYFTASTRAIDNSIATLRLIESRIDVYKRLLADAREVLKALIDVVGQADRRLRVIDVELAEARHDLATARSLLAEEEARVAAVNERRALTIGKHSAMLLYRRPRRTDRMLAVPTAPTVPALAPTPLAACRREHRAPPEEVEEYVSLFRDLPGRAFAAVAARIDLVDRLHLARAALAGVRLRALREPVRKVVDPAPRPRFVMAARSALAGQLAAAETRRMATLRLDLAAVQRLDLAATRQRLAEHATLGDLIEGAHQRPELSRIAASELEAVGDVAACLHAGISEVPPIVRLGWAEILSEFDRPIPLAHLSELPRWGEIPLDLRREMQGLVNWLFSRIDRQFEPAERAINELIRICILMAAHAPVDRLIPARLVAPAPLRIGAVLTLATQVELVRVGMSALIRRDDGSPMARAQVEDIGDGIARARITEQMDRTVTTVAAGFRVELAHIGRL